MRSAWSFFCSQTIVEAADVRISSAIEVVYAISLAFSIVGRTRAKGLADLSLHSLNVFILWAFIASVRSKKAPVFLIARISPFLRCSLVRSIAWPEAITCRPLSTSCSLWPQVLQQSVLCCPTLLATPYT